MEHLPEKLAPNHYIDFKDDGMKNNNKPTAFF
jgi:hypothetical protein